MLVVMMTTRPLMAMAALLPTTILDRQSANAPAKQRGGRWGGSRQWMGVLFHDARQPAGERAFLGCRYPLCQKGHPRHTPVRGVGSRTPPPVGPCFRYNFIFRFQQSK